MPFEKSAGAIIFYRCPEGKIEYLLLRHNERYWAFPKGLIEKEEELEETALREVKEETGLKDLIIVDGFKETVKLFFKVKYDYQTKRGLKVGQTVLKFVTYFLAESKSKNVKLSFEHDGYEWLAFEEIMERIKKYKTNQEVLIKANDYLVKHKT